MFPDMKSYIQKTFLLIVLVLGVQLMFAGNPDRQGEAGAGQLLLNPWARSAGLHTMNTSMVSGIEAMRLNVAGLSRIAKSEFAFGHTRYLDGADISINSFGFAQRMGNGALGVSIMAMDLGDIAVTTENQPEGTGATYSPSLVNLGIAYSHTFENKVSVGILFRGVTESTADLSAFAFAIDAGVQYVTGPQDNFKCGISLRNVGTKMNFQGQGISDQLPSPNPTFGYELSYFARSQAYELPSVLNIGTSYDFYVTERHRITVLGNFTANSFSEDQIGAGVEYSFNKLFSLRAAYKEDFGATAEDNLGENVETGFSAGFSFDVPLKKDSENRLGIDYSYRDTQPFDGTHNLTVRFSL